MIKALIFDINGTIVDILTDESRDDLYRTVSNLLDYQGVKLAPDALRERFWEINKRQRRESLERHPEFDAAGIFREILESSQSERLRSMPASKREALPEFLAQAFRAASRLKLELYPEAKAVLESLSLKYRMAALSDGQSIWARPELESVGAAGFFETVLVSSDFGFRKPEPKFFQTALDALGLSPAEAVFVGNDMYRDVWGAKNMGMRAVYFKSNQGDQKSRGLEPDYVIYSFKQLPEALRFLEARESLPS